MRFNKSGALMEDFVFPGISAGERVNAWVFAATDVGATPKIMKDSLERRRRGARASGVIRWSVSSSDYLV